MKQHNTHGGERAGRAPMEEEPPYHAKSQNKNIPKIKTTNNGLEEAGRGRGRGALHLLNAVTRCSLLEREPVT